MIVVVDASVALKWYIEEDDTAKAETLLNGVYQLNAPELILPEFGNILWKKVRRGETTAEEARSVLTLFRNQNIRLHRHQRLIQSAYFGAEITGQTVYDWTYLALAVALNCPFVTADRKFYKILESTNLRKHLLWVGDL